MTSLRRVALIGNLDGLHAGAPGAHTLHRRRRKYVGIGAANDQHRHAGERIEFMPQRWHRTIDIDARERTRDAEIVGRL